MTARVAESVPAPVPVVRVPHAAAPVVLSELAGARAERVWAVAATVAGVLAVVLLLAGLVAPGVVLS